MDQAMSIGGEISDFVGTMMLTVDGDTFVAITLYRGGLGAHHGHNGARTLQQRRPRRLPHMTADLIVQIHRRYFRT